MWVGNSAARLLFIPASLLSFCCQPPTHRLLAPVCLLQWRERALAAEAQLAGDNAAAPSHRVVVTAGKAAAGAVEDSPGTKAKKGVEA